MGVRIPDLNRVQLAGRLTRDPELTYTPNNMAVCKFGIASTRYYRTKDGERREETVFVDCVAWGKTAEIVAEHVRKGAPVIVEGNLRLNEWQDKTTGETRRKLEITVDRVHQLEWADDGQKASTAKPTTQPAAPAETEDDIPF